jgi:hypothetical protein
MFMLLKLTQPCTAAEGSGILRAVQAVGRGAASGDNKPSAGSKQSNPGRHSRSSGCPRVGAW